MTPDYCRTDETLTRLEWNFWGHEGPVVRERLTSVKAIFASLCRKWRIDKINKQVGTLQARRWKLKKKLHLSCCRCSACSPRTSSTCNKWTFRRLFFSDNRLFFIWQRMKSLEEKIGVEKLAQVPLTSATDSRESLLEYIYIYMYEFKKIWGRVKSKCVKPWASVLRAVDETLDPDLMRPRT